MIVIRRLKMGRSIYLALSRPPSIYRIKIDNDLTTRLSFDGALTDSSIGVAKQTKTLSKLLLGMASRKYWLEIGLVGLQQSNYCF